MIALNDPFRLPCGVVLRNRLVRSAMTEGLADAQSRATQRHETLYRRWARCGPALQLTGNVMIDRHVLERPGNVAVDVTHPPSISNDARAALKRWAKAGTVDDTQLWMQLSHAGRQSPRYVARTPLAPSAVPLKLLGNYATPRALREDEILDFIARFGAVARIARECGFTGVQVHGAHGYLISSFLSPVTNRRDDAWGGSLENRARFLVECVRTARRAVGDDFPVAVKLNSDDFRKGGFSQEDCLGVVRMLNGERIDLLEISGGNYEQPRLLGFEGMRDSVMPVRASTRRREAYFLAYAEAIRPLATMPLMLTGGFRSRAAMEEALNDDVCDLIGIARPMCTHPQAVRALLDRTLDALPSPERTLMLRPRGVLSPTSPLLPLRVINVLGATAWYYGQILRLADGLAPRLDRGVLNAFVRYCWNELRGAWRLRR